MTRDEYIRSEFDECWRCRHFQMLYHHSTHEPGGGGTHCYTCGCHRIFGDVGEYGYIGGHGYVPITGDGHSMVMCVTDDDRKLKSVGYDIAGFLLDESRWRKCDRYVERLVALSNVEDAE